MLDINRPQRRISRHAFFFVFRSCRLRQKLAALKARNAGQPAPGGLGPGPDGQQPVAGPGQASPTPTRKTAAAVQKR